MFFFQILCHCVESEPGVSYVRALSDFPKLKNDEGKIARRNGDEDDNEGSNPIDDADWLNSIRTGDAIRVSKRLFRQETKSQNLYYGTLDGRVGFFPAQIAKKVPAAELVVSSRATVKENE